MTTEQQSADTAWRAEQLSWLEVAGFVKLYRSQQSGNKTYKQAYEDANKLFYEVFRRNRYSDFQSFAQSKWKWEQRQKKKEEDLKK